MPQPLFLGAVAAVTTSLAWLHARSAQPRAEEREELDREGLPPPGADTQTHEREDV
jgi:hypothetical protein